MTSLLTMFLTISSSAASTSAFVIGLIAAACFTFALVPPFLDVYKSNKTFGLTEKFIIYAFSAAIIFSILGFLTIINGNVGVGLIMVITNGLSFGVNFYIWGKKKRNLKLATEHNMSEMDYFFMHIEPELNKNSKEQTAAIEKDSQDSDSNKTPN